MFDILQLDNFEGDVQLNLMYIPSMGFFIVTNYDAAIRQDSDVTFAFKSNSGQQHYYNSTITTFLNDNIGDLVSQMTQVEREVIGSLQKAILTHAQECSKDDNYNVNATFYLLDMLQDDFF